SGAESIFAGNVINCDCGVSTVEVRNKIHAGDTLEVLKPDGTLSKITLPNPLTDSKGEYLKFANNSQYLLITEDLPEYTILRRITK
ncbi:MAG: U32 family peptidase C-terminal domain-containing protein, partial [Planctomycetota bacterium]